VSGHAQDVYVAVADFECEQDVEPPQGHRAVDVEEVDGEHSGGLAAQEPSPAGVNVADRRPWDPVAPKDPTDGPGADAVAELEQLTLDPATCPGAEARGAGPVEESAASVVWAATLPADGPIGGFFRYTQSLAW
jgi:hypothetical protein